MSEEATPDLRTVIERHVERGMRGMVGPQIGKVTAYDSARQVASVQPLVQEVLEDEFGQRVTRTRPIVQGVPVLFLRGAGGGTTYPVEVGDLALLIPCGSSIARWFTRGGDLAIVDPGESTGTLNDAFALVGGHRASTTSVPGDAVVIYAEDQVRLGGTPANQSVLRGDSFRSALDDLLDALNTFANANLGGPAMTTAINVFKATWATHLSDKIKLE